MSYASIWSPRGTRCLFKREPPVKASPPDESGTLEERAAQQWKAFSAQHPKGVVYTPRKHEDPRATIFTTRFSQRLWPRAAQPNERLTSFPYQAPPAPAPLKRPLPPDAKVTEPEELQQVADDLIERAEQLEVSRPVPTVRVQLGLVLLTKDDYIKRVLKEWDIKGRGEFLKGEFRVNLRNLGLNVTSAQADELFDSWDDDRGGSLDLKELRRSLVQAQDAARSYQNMPDVSAERAAKLRVAAEVAREAAQAAEVATQLEQEHRQFAKSMANRADIQLGALLYKRRIRPGAMVAMWSAPKGAHAGELSKADFRTFCVSLGLPSTTTDADIDSVFAQFDDDGGGYMDEAEAKAMIKGLQVLSEKMDQEVRQKERKARAMRVKAQKLAVAALAPQPEEEEPEPPPMLEPPPAPKPKAKAKQPKKPANPLTKEPDAGSSEEARRQEEAVQAIAMKIGQRIQNAALAKGFTTWAERHAERMRAMEVINAVAARWKQPPLIWMLNAWIAYWERRLDLMDLKDIVTQHWRVSAPRSALKRWQWYGVERSRDELLRFRVQKLRRRLITSHPESRQWLSAVLHAWRREARSRHGPQGLCAALGACLTRSGSQDAAILTV